MLETSYWNKQRPWPWKHDLDLLKGQQYNVLLIAHKRSIFLQIFKSIGLIFSEIPPKNLEFGSYRYSQMPIIMGVKSYKEHCFSLTTNIFSFSTYFYTLSLLFGRDSFIYFNTSLDYIKSKCPKRVIQEVVTLKRWPWPT